MNQRRIEKLSAAHPVSAFDCGKPALNDFLRRYALQNQQAGSSQTYVGLDDDELVGYYTLTFGSAEHHDVPARIGKGLARHPIPLMVLARLAVARDRQARGIGKALLKDAVLRTVQAADIAGLRALALHAKDDDARAFYARYDFAPSPTDEYHLFVLVKDIKKTLGLS